MATVTTKVMPRKGAIIALVVFRSLGVCSGVSEPEGEVQSAADDQGNGVADEEGRSPRK